MSPRQINYKIRTYGIDWQAYRPNSEEPTPDLKLGEFAQAIVDEAFRKM